jgi:hypothetical protein
VAAHNAAWRNSPRDRKLITVVFDPGVQVRPQGRDQTAKKSAKWGQTKPPPQNYVENNVAPVHVCSRTAVEELAKVSCICYVSGPCRAAAVIYALDELRDKTLGSFDSARAGDVCF